MDMLKRLRILADEAIEASIEDAENIIFRLIEAAEAAIPAVQSESEKLKLKRENAELLKTVEMLKVEIERLKMGNVPAGLADQESDLN